MVVDDYLQSSSKFHRAFSGYLLRVGLQHRSEVHLGPFKLDVVIGNDFVLEVGVGLHV